MVKVVGESRLELGNAEKEAVLLLEEDNGLKCWEAASCNNWSCRRASSTERSQQCPVL